MNLLVNRIEHVVGNTPHSPFGRDIPSASILFERAVYAGYCKCQPPGLRKRCIVSSASRWRSITQASRCQWSVLGFVTWWKIGFIYVEKLSKRCCISFRLLYNYVIGCCSFEESDPTSLVTCHKWDMTSSRNWNSKGFLVSVVENRLPTNCFWEVFCDSQVLTFRRIYPWPRKKLEQRRKK